LAQAPIILPAKVMKQGGKLMMSVPMMMQKQVFWSFFVECLGLLGWVFWLW